MLNQFAIAAVVLLAAVGAAAAAPPKLPSFDFTSAAEVQRWWAAHDVGPLVSSGEGMRIQVTGIDPYVIGPPEDYPADLPLWLEMEVDGEAGTWQVFYYNGDASEDNSVRIPVGADGPTTLRAPLPALGPSWRIRIDPPAASRSAVVRSLRFQPRRLLKEPEWPVPQAPAPEDLTAVIQSADLELRFDPARFGSFAINVQDQPFAIGGSRPLIGWMKGEEPQWLDLSSAAVRAGTADGWMWVAAEAKDSGGATWTLRLSFRPHASRPGVLDWRSNVRVNQARDVAYLPMFMLFPGAESFGTSKNQGLFAGLEYLADEPSSTEADILGPQSKRQVPDNLKITFPLMAIQADSSYLALTWDMDDRFSAVFDSPDRLYRSGGHVMGIIYPGSDGVNRVEGNLLPYKAVALPPNQPLQVQGSILGGAGEDVTAALKAYINLKPLPALPSEGVDRDLWVKTASGGWLDSAIREGSQLRHAVWPGFGPSAAADAPLAMSYLASQVQDEGLRDRLLHTASTAIRTVSPADFDFAKVSHVSLGLPSLLYGDVEANATAARRVAVEQLQRFDDDDRILYQRPESGPDYSRTHFEKEANGLTAPVVALALERAVQAGDRELIAEALNKLQTLNRFLHTVPRGAQTWEVPLHTPDILAAAHLVRAYVLGYELTGDPNFLENADYWAWTGVPFVYLRDPAKDGPIGRYATIAVFGATGWISPVWFGQPVQWCGLVYADALYKLARHQTGGIWKTLADGITLSGIQQSWPISDTQRQGLLPDFFLLRTQHRDGPAINPGTVQANAVRALGLRAMFDRPISTRSGVMVHAPGQISDWTERGSEMRFTVTPWTDRPYYILIGGLDGPAPRVWIDGVAPEIEPPHGWNQSAGRLVLHLQGERTVRVGVN